MRATYITAIVIAVALGLWLASGQLGESEAPPPVSLAAEKEQLAAEQEDKAPTQVRARVINAQPFTQQLTVRGRTETKRAVAIRAETAGRIIDRPIERGSAVEEGDLLCRLAIDDRQAGLNEAREALNQRHIEYRGALKLKAQGFQSDTAIAQAKARLAQAEAQLKRSQIEVARTEIRAPFAGLVEDTHLEVGDYVSPGNPCATVVDLHPMLLVGEVAEKDVLSVQVGKTAEAELTTGRTVAGEITFVAQQSRNETRTYPIEVHVDNQDRSLRSGITAEIQIPVREVLAQKVSPALLALNDGGEVGVRILDADNRVQFLLVNILDDEPDGVWLTGLPNRATLITVGQELVVPGEQVLVEYEAEREMPAAAPTQPSSKPAPSEPEEGASSTAFDPSNRPA